MPAEVAEIATPSQAEKRGVQGRLRSVRPATANTNTQRPMPAPMYHFQYGKLLIGWPGGYFKFRRTESYRPQ